MTDASITRDVGIPEIERYELDGIPLAHLPMAGGSTILTIAFAVGRTHEPLLRGGMTHLAEHLLMIGLADRIDRHLDHSNGTTEPFRVTFSLRGTPQDASRFLAELCREIERPRLSRMHEEINVLRTEAAGRGPGGLSFRAIWYRTGYQWLGTVNLPELFLHAPDEDVLRAWMAENLVAGNAAIWIAGELPDDLYVSLPPGPRRPVPEPAWVPQFATPTLVRESGPGVAASFFVERSVAATAAFRTLDARLTKALRVDRGLGYEVGSDYMPVNADRAMATVWATCLPAAVREVQQTLLETIDDVAARGPSDDDLREQYERMSRDAGEVMAVPGRLDAHVRNELLGAEFKTVASMLEEHGRLESADVAAAFRQARDSMLLMIPDEGIVPQRPFQPYPGPVLGALGRGRTFDLAGVKAGAPWRKAKAPTLTVADGGLTIDEPGGARMVGIPWAETVAVLRRPGIRTVLCLDGSACAIESTEWKDGRSAMELIDQFAPRNVVVEMRD